MLYVLCVEVQLADNIQWEPDEQQYAVAYVVFSSVGGSVVGPIVGAFVQRYLDWRWVSNIGPSHTYATN
jgi:MFS family permease